MSLMRWPNWKEMKRSLNNIEQISNDKIKVRIQSNPSDICISDLVLDAEET